MALVVENGTGVVGANSYVTLVEVRAYAADRGLVVPADDAVLTSLVILAGDYIDNEPFGPYKGDKTVLTVDTRKWPRTNVNVDSIDYDPNTVPKRIKDAQCQMAFEMQTTDPTPTQSNVLIKRERVDVVETEYAVDYKAGQKNPTMTKIANMLRPLLRNPSWLSVVRV